MPLECFIPGRLRGGRFVSQETCLNDNVDDDKGKVYHSTSFICRLQNGKVSWILLKIRRPFFYKNYIKKGEGILMKRFFSKGKLVIVLALIVLLIAGCGGGEKTEEPAKNDELVVVRLPGADGGYPQPYSRLSRGPSLSKVNYIFDSLIEAGPEGYIPWLAKTVDMSEDGLTFTLTLADNAKWHDGKDVTAEDVAFTIAYGQEFLPVTSNIILTDKDFVKELNVIDPATIQFVLSKTDVNFLGHLKDIHILPKHIWEGVEKPDEFLTPEAVIGSGPFILTNYEKEHGIYRFEKNKDFWGPEVMMDVLEFVPVSDEVLALEKGEIDWANIPIDVLSTFDKDPKFVQAKNPIVWAYRLRFNMNNNEAISKPEVRQAMAYAINRQDLLDKVGRGAGALPSMGILPPGHIMYNKDLPKYDRDIEKAKELLAKAGVAGKDASFELLLADNNEVRMGEIIKENLAEIGIDVTIKAVDGKTRDNRLSEGTYQVALTGNGGWGNDADYLRGRFTNNPKSFITGVPGYKNEELEKLFVAQLKELDATKRKALIFEIQEILAEDIPELPLYFTQETVVYNKDVYDNWVHVFNHHNVTHNKLSFVKH